ncbi:MAG: flagellar basal body rod protein FlgB [Buchnera aphidicola (Floraphis choui)]
MLNKLDKEFYLNTCSLNLHAYRQELLASNIANSNTPNYRSLDIDFPKILNTLIKENTNQPKYKLTVTSKNHISVSKNRNKNNYDRIVSKNYIVNNDTVNIDSEKINFIKNSLLYQMDIILINNKFKNLMNVLKG